MKVFICICGFLLVISCKEPVDIWKSRVPTRKELDIFDRFMFTTISWKFNGSEYNIWGDEVHHFVETLNNGDKRCWSIEYCYYNDKVTNEYIIRSNGYYTKKDWDNWRF